VLLRLFFTSNFKKILEKSKNACFKNIVFCYSMQNIFEDGPAIGRGNLANKCAKWQWFLPFMVCGSLLETFNIGGPLLSNNFSVYISFVVFHPSAGRKWLITVNKSCARGLLVNVLWLPRASMAPSWKSLIQYKSQQTYWMRSFKIYTLYADDNFLSLAHKIKTVCKITLHYKLPKINVRLKSDQIVYNVNKTNLFFYP